MPVITDRARREETWTIDGMTYTEMDCQAYQNMVISAGHIDSGAVPGHERNTIYLRIESDDAPEFFGLFTSDEALAIIRVLSGALWAERVDALPDPPTEKE